ncbi:uncharacterized protein LOC114121491 isoform X1 [Aphis gossypii]|uniref:Uncharacterized protein n=1 Tax=Aphis gossypii TaxID=80765 RepID=A0A9P0NSM5_APHGO|nr:uncharacterized protein LOC114121491 isoform X1 [Aphis gossypii]XP_050060528.1 uncharacterized protein LOC114121491 isoform X1 [Aphis gossypii]CAH1738129.1 unnamed protein product [Aphis gossypii]
MGYYNIIPKKSSTLHGTKKKIHINSVVTLCHCIIVFFWIICTNPWPSDFRDHGFHVLLNLLIYLFFINLLNGLFLYDEYIENTNEYEEYGPVFKLCKTTRHILFWTYGFFIHIWVITIGLQKLNTALEFKLDRFYVKRVCFLLWSVIFFCIDVYWLMKTCVYHQIINEETENTDQQIIIVKSNK